MPIYEVKCMSCGAQSEVLAGSSQEKLACPACGAPNPQKLISATSSLTGAGGQELPGPGDHTCCGSAPGTGSCAGPGSCCGKA